MIHFKADDKVAIRDCSADNAKWKFDRIIRRDGELYYIINVQGNLVSRHIDQIWAAGEEVDNDIQYRPRVLAVIEPEMTSTKSDPASIEPPMASEDISKDMPRTLPPAVSSLVDTSQDVQNPM